MIASLEEGLEDSNEELIEIIYTRLESSLLDRDYSVFGKLAGVRDDKNEPISLPKGLPSDSVLSSHNFNTFEETVNNFTKIYISEGFQNHSFSNLLLSELLAVDWFKELQKKFTYIDENGDEKIFNKYQNKDDMEIIKLINKLKAYTEDNSLNTEDNSLNTDEVRMLFYFDN